MATVNNNGIITITPDVWNYLSNKERTITAKKVVFQQGKFDSEDNYEEVTDEEAQEIKTRQTHD